MLDLARLAASTGGTVLRSRRGNMGQVRRKAWSIDLVTEADVDSGVATVRTIVEHLPGARIIVEETEVYDLLGIEPASTEEPDYWLVDPLDGTTSFVHGYPCYSVAVAHVTDGVPDVGAIFNAASAELFSAAAGQGADRDGVPISCTQTESVNEALLITGFPYDRGEPLDRQMAVLGAFLRAPIHGIRRDGSAAVDCTHVACGQADGFWEYALKPWDMAAGAVICREAGAVASDVTGRPWDVSCTSICTANPRLHDRMLDVIRAAGGATG
jgi:myo-inositol-1(or 4)-monophosphatase